MNYKIIDNFLSEENFKKIQSIILGNSKFSDFPWFINYNVVDSDSESKCLYSYQFTHMIYNECCPKSKYFELMYPILNKLNIISLIKIKVNLNPVTKEKIQFDWHVDYKTKTNKFKTAIYYINTNNGKTLLRENDSMIEVDSVENRILIFDQNLEHTGTTCTDKKIRCLINFNYVEWT
jgi:hypothetical protein